MPSFGTSEQMVYTATGPLQLKGETVEVCPTCEDSENGPCRFHVISKDHKSARLVCPNCGDQKSVLIEALRMLADGPNPRAPIGPPTDPSAAQTSPTPTPAPTPSGPPAGSQTAAIVGRLLAEQQNAVDATKAKKTTPKTPVKKSGPRAKKTATPKKTSARGRKKS